MKIYNINEKLEYLKPYFELCTREWGNYKNECELEEKVQKKVIKYLNKDFEKIISVLILLDKDNLVGFISLFKTDGSEKQDLTPWYATMYVKSEYRKKGCSKILNEAILQEAKRLGYDKVYLKSDLVNYYEKFGARYLETLKNGEKLYVIELR